MLRADTFSSYFWISFTMAIDTISNDRNILRVRGFSDICPIGSDLNRSHLYVNIRLLLYSFYILR